jgi:archaetidylinositol phosphate synthase
MLSRLQYLVEGFFESSAVAFHKAGFSPNLTTIVGFVLTVAVGVMYYAGLPSMSTWLVAWVLLLVASYFDALDGAMARRFRLVSRAGGVLDSVLDRIGEIVLYSAIGLGGLVDLRICLWALGASLMVSYVRARVEVEGVKLKGVGIAERPERLLILLVSTILNPFLGVLTWGVLLIALLASVTVVERVYAANRYLSIGEMNPQNRLSSAERTLETPK